LPFLAFWLLRNYPWRRALRAAAVSLVGGLLIILPFFPKNPFGLIEQLVDASKVSYNPN